MKIRTLIVDDERLARNLIRTLLKRESDFEIVGECEDGSAAVSGINTLSPDLVFLDIQMPERGGFEVLKSIDPARTPVVVFVTAHDKFALQAFEARALDYLLKPVDEERFYETLRRVKASFESRATAALQERLTEFMQTLSTPTKSISRLAVKADGRLLFLKVEEIDWIGSDGNYLGLHVGKQNHLLRGRLIELEKKLPPGQFFRIHRSTIVNLDRVKEFKPLFKGEGIVVLRDGTQLDASRHCSQKLRDFLDARL